MRFFSEMSHDIIYFIQVEKAVGQVLTQMKEALVGTFRLLRLKMGQEVLEVLKSWGCKPWRTSSVQMFWTKSHRGNIDD